MLQPSTLLRSHCFKLIFGFASTWRRSPTFIVSFPESSTRFLHFRLWILTKNSSPLLPVLRLAATQQTRSSTHDRWPFWAIENRRPKIENSHYLVTFAVWDPCFLNTRVGENSPSLCPTIFSVTKTELKIFPLCTKNVWPTKSGVTIERRDQVLIGLFAPELFILSIFSKRCDSTKGPFFSDLPIFFK